MPVPTVLFSCGQNREFVKNHCENSDACFESTLSQLSEGILINGHLYQLDTVMEEIKPLVTLLRKKWTFLQTSVIDQNTEIIGDHVTNIRNDINQILQGIIHCIWFCDRNNLRTEYLSRCQEQIQTFEKLVVKLTKLEIPTCNQLFSYTVKQQTSPSYHFVHTLFEMHYYFLVLDFIDRKNTHMETTLRELFYLSKRNYDQGCDGAFLCDCHKALWLTAQLLSGEAFWTLFNQISEEYEMGFALWLLKEVASSFHCGEYFDAIDRFPSNIALIDRCMKNVISNEQLSKCLQHIQPLVGSLWIKTANIELYQLIWDNFNKRLNTFSSNIGNVEEIVDRIDTILWTPKDCANEFDLFVALLISHLGEHPQHWGKIKGRIYTQLSQNKTNELDHVGIFHLLLLLVSLTKINFEELSKKISSFLEQLPADKKHSQHVWSLYMAFIVRHVRENRNIESVIRPMLKMLEDAASDHNLHYLLKRFCKDFNVVIKCSGNLQLQQCLLLNSWIHEYMSKCYHQDLVATLQMLTSLIDRINNDNVWYDWERSYRNYVFVTLKHICNSPKAPELCGILAAKITVLSPNLLSESFAYFNEDSIAPKVTSNYLCTIFEDRSNLTRLSENQEGIATRSWARICLLSAGKHENLTKIILELSTVPQFLKDSISNSKDPLHSLINTLGAHCGDRTKIPHLNKLCEHCFGNLEQWVSNFFSTPESEAAVFRVLTLIAHAFYKVGSLLYDKHKSSSIFSRFFAKVLLPTEVLMNQSLNSYILNGIKETWHLFFEATVKLNTCRDSFLDRVLRDLVVKYMPHFGIIDSPIMKCLDNENVSGVILAIMSDAFFSHPVMEPESTVSRALRIINDFAQHTTSLTAMKLVVGKTLFGLFEVALFHSQHATGIAVITSIISSPLYPQVKNDFATALIAIIEKHMTNSPGSFFKLLNILSKMIAGDVKKLIPKIRQRIAQVENIHGRSGCENLRMQLKKIEDSVAHVL